MWISKIVKMLLCGSIIFAVAGCGSSIIGKNIEEETDLEAERWEEVVLKETSPKSIAIHNYFMAALLSDGTIRVVKSDEYYVNKEDEWSDFYNKISTLHDVVQIETPHNGNDTMLVALKSDGTLYSTKDEQQNIIKNWSNIKSIESVRNHEIIALSDTGKIYQYNEEGVFISDDYGFINLYQFLFVKSDGSVIVSEYPDTIKAEKLEGIWKESRESFEKWGQKNFSAILELNDVKSICDDYSSGFIVLKRDGSIWQLPQKGGKMQNRDELQGNDFTQVVSGFVVAGLKRDGTVKILTTESRINDYQAASDWTDIVSLYAKTFSGEKTLLVGVTKNGDIRTAGSHWYFGSETDNTSNKPQISEFGFHDIMVP